MEELIIVSKWNNQNFTGCKPDEVDKAIEEAKRFYQEHLDLVKSNLENYPKDEKFWKERINEYSGILKGGFEAVTFEEYRRREISKWVTGKVSKISQKEYESALGELPPLNYTRIDDASWFFICEMLTLSVTNQYYHDRTNDRYYTALVDLYDRNTWIDKLLKK